MIGAARAVLLRAPAELRPDVDENAVGQPARLEVALEGEQRVGGELEPVGESRLVVVGVVGARARERDDVKWQTRSEHRGEPGEPLREASSPPGYATGLVNAGLSSLARNGVSWRVELRRLARPLRRLAQAGVAAGRHAPSRPIASIMRSPDLAPDASGPEVVVSGASTGRDRHFRRRERGLRGSSRATVPAAGCRPSRRGRGSGRASRSRAARRRADLPEMTRGEMRLVRVVVADRRHHVHLALAVQRARAERATGARSGTCPR